MSNLSASLDAFREKFEHYEETAKTMSYTEIYKSQLRRIRQPKKHFDETNEPNAALTFTASQKFKRETFLPVIDQLKVALEARIGAYNCVRERFGFLQDFQKMNKADVRRVAEEDVKLYPNDVSIDLPDEFHQFLDWFTIHHLHDTGEDTLSVQRMLNLIVDGHVEATFPDTATVLRIYLSLMITNCSGERSFSYLKLVKSDRRSTMSQERLVALSLLTIERDILREISFETVIESFASKKARKTDIAGQTVQFE